MKHNSLIIVSEEPEELPSLFVGYVMRKLEIKNRVNSLQIYICFENGRFLHRTEYYIISLEFCSSLYVSLSITLHKI